MKNWHVVAGRKTIWTVKTIAKLVFASPVNWTFNSSWSIFLNSRNEHERLENIDISRHGKQKFKENLWRDLITYRVVNIFD